MSFSSKSSEYFIWVKTNSKKQRVEKIGDNQLKVFIHASPHEGKANKELIKILGSFFDIAPSRIHIIIGLRSKTKIIEIL